MAVEWSWEEFDAEHSVLIILLTHSATFSNTNLLQFFAKYGKFTSYVRLNASKCIAVAKYESKSDVARALNDKCLRFYGLETKKINEYPMCSQFDVSLYTYKGSQEIIRILQGNASESDEKPIVLPAFKLNQIPKSKQMPCSICNADYCPQNGCVTKEWMEKHAKTELELVPVADYFEDDLIEPPTKCSKLDLLDEEYQSADDNMQSMTLPNKSKVFLTYVSNSKIIYVRSAERSESRAYINLLRSIGDYIDHAVPLIEVPAQGAIIAAIFEGIFYRCRVIYVSVHSDDILVDFIDFGNVEKIKFADARYLPQEFQTIKPTVTMITLKGLTDQNSNAMRHLKLLVGKIMKLILYYENGDTECELFDDKTGESINAYLLNPINDPVVKQIKQRKREIEYILTDGRNVPVLIINSSLIKLDYMSCILRKDMKRFQLNDILVNQIGASKQLASKPAYSPTAPGDLCLVKCCDEYYRAILIDSKYRSCHRFEFVDYGYILPVENKDIRQLPDELLFPCITLKCFIDLFPPIHTKQPNITDSQVISLQKYLQPFKPRTLAKITSNKSLSICICSL